jgi:LacI family repressor for deo operon, udp, cdd, tsx, nupC, and nupG
LDHEITAPQQSRPTTIKEVALDLGLSVATVSRALVHPEKLRPDTRERVLEAVERLGYQPNLIARDLRMRESRLVFVIVPSLSPFFFEVFRGVERAARESGYSVLMGHTKRDIGREHMFFDQVASRRADGIILMTSADDAAMPAMHRMPPVVAALEAIEGQVLPTVRIDHRKAARTATEYLLSLGHRRIAHISGPVESPIARSRKRGFEEAMTAAGLDPLEAPGLEGDFSVSSGEEAMVRLLDLDSRPTAIFAANDEMAVGAIQTIKRAGLTIGRDISVIGFDDQRIATLYDPPLTTIRVPTEELGYEAMLLLQRALRGDVVEMDRVFETEVVVRSTTGPPPPAAPQISPADANVFGRQG